MLRGDVYMILSVEKVRERNNATLKLLVPSDGNGKGGRRGYETPYKIKKALFFSG